MIKVNNLTKIIKGNYVNKNISFNLNKGEIIGIVGPNGAGKTTLFRQITGFINSDEGEIKINNINPWGNQHKIFNFSGYVLGENIFFETLTAIDYLKTHLILKGINDFKILEYLIKYFELDEHKKIKNLSKGNKQKVAIILAFSWNPSLMILDEPTSGLDPVMQKKFINLAMEFNNKYNTTILISSHILSEIYSLCNKVFFLKRGEFIKEVNNKNIALDELNKIFEKLYYDDLKVNLPNENFN